MRLFLSHASEQKDLARYVYQALLQEGHKVFFDESDLHVARGYHAEIRGEVELSDGFVFLISEQSLSPGCYTLTELGYAKKKWKDPTGRVLPVLVAPVPMASVDPYLRSVTVLRPKGNVAAEVAAAIEEWRAPDGAPTAAARPADDLPFYINCTASKVASQRRTLYLQIALASGALLTGLGVMSLAQLYLHVDEIQTIFTFGGAAMASLAVVAGKGIFPARTKLSALESLRIMFESLPPEAAVAESDSMARLKEMFYKLLEQELGST